MYERTIDDQLPHQRDVVGSDRFGEGELPGEDWWNSDFVGFNVDVGRDDRSCSVVDSFAL